MSKAKLATFRIDENDWDAFQGWAKAKGTNASSELIGFVQACIGKGDRLSVPEQLDNDIDGRIDKQIQAAIAPILARLEALELKAVHAPVQPTPKNIDTEENAPLLPFLAENVDIAENSPPTMPVNPDENVISTSLSKLLLNDVTDDLTKGLNQSELAIRYVVSRQSVGNAIKRGTITQWLKKQGADFDGICWRYDSEKKLFFPEK